MRVDVLNTAQTPWKGRLLLDHAFKGALRCGLDARMIHNGPVRDDAWLVLYGLGAQERVGYVNREKLIAFDAGYWDRRPKPDARRYRVALGGFHSPQWIMRGEDPGADRWNASHPPVYDYEPNPAAAIMLVGNGPKSNAVGAGGWSAAKARELRAKFPGRSILYRPKPKRPDEPGVEHDGKLYGAIDDALRSTSLVVCRHSNVAVDAARAGVPVVCDDGAAAAIYPKALSDWRKQPSAELRREFLRRLAWWQWTPVECRDGEFWPWMQRTLSA